jgi:pimeloyl-ACP methyl ester carboxylesterase
VAIDALDLRVPSFEHLRFSAIEARIRAAIDGAGTQGPPESQRAVLIGSSLGGLAACRVAAADPRVCAVLAMAPAFRLVPRWRARLGERAWERWRREGFLEVDDHATRTRSRVDFGFVEELDRLDVGLPDVRVPTLVVHGTNDDVVDIEGSRDFARGAPHVRLVEVDDGHELGASIDRILSEAKAFFASFGIAERP